jgi:hypothetical protein
MSKIVKRFLILIGLILTTLTIVYWDLVVYGIRQGKGQHGIIWNARPVEEFLADPTFPDSLKAKLRLIPQIMDFDEMNAAWEAWVPSPPPARACVEARLADPRLKIEIQVHALK